MGIFTVSLAAVAQLITTGVRASVQARLQTQAILRCETKLAELTAGVEPLISVSETEFEDDPFWVWTAEVLPAPVPDLLELVVTVSHLGETEMASVSFTLQRYVRDPNLVFDAWLDQSLQQALESR